MTLPPELHTLGDRPLLVICDYDGTLAPIVHRPEDAFPQPGAREALRRLTAHPAHHAAIVTGRRAEQVHAFLNLPDLPVIGLHGMEWPGEEIRPPNEEALRFIAAQLPDVPGLWLEDKRWTLAVHYRAVPEAQQANVEAALAAVPLPEGWEVIAGKKIREFRPAGFGKGRAAQQLALTFPLHLPVFLGDDVTDEEGFVALRGQGGVTVKVGEGATAAEYRIASPAEVVALLEAWADTPA
ncbi:trehalose-phosphatase [Deinococcus metallilatus]|uniref:Trehalose 6-phosphate phosphatase n=1 Tax=Deinococcus metallilatus TaxID=1211322 RepID=A0AAJ5FAB9_9DEIO|nr:trehalose-phosphatase [Deinococcus metallilatus]MBB5294547.1 trehalose 6-phosphate phosphatase [Deinococcus metallilatus]QBY07592.1 trehalose-phosphatase [Deinococcus metallilatus]RXJ14008.1 trehalose-phosphatase [Deinococcus metallilatus]TLK29973.1 trehalose-phosphatase [Deinococcus metallilatus]GMA15760.1 trehalose 6-phosphate phosphatase [Deinococcus metallilatus]